jgi:hypothetical protein
VSKAANSVGRGSLEVTFECTAFHETGMLLAAVLAMPLP